MSLKMITFLVLGVLALTCENFAKVPEFCKLKPDVSIFGSQNIKWGYFPDKKDCFEFQWNGIWTNGNIFNTKEECLKTCQQPKLNYTTIDNCVCFCPNKNDPSATKTVIKPNVVAIKTETPPTTPQPTTTSTTPIPETTTTSSWFSGWFSR